MEYLTIREISKLWKMKERKVTSLCRDNRIAGVKKDGNSWLVPSDAIKPMDMRTKEFEESKIIKEEKGISYTECSTDDRIIEAFREKYKCEPEYTAFTPYRVCPLGAHTDHNLGKVTGFAINKGIHIAYSIKHNGIVEVESLQFPKRGQWHILNVPIEKENDWADSLRGATISLSKRYPLKYGLKAVIDGELPIGGISTASAMILTFISALAFLNDIKLSNEELIAISNEAETKYVGLSNGKLDQSCELYAKKNKLLYVDLLDDSHRLIESSNKMNFEIAIFFSGLTKSLEPNTYNKRVDELRSCAYVLKEYEGIPVNRFQDTNMRDIPYEIYLKHKDKLPNNFIKRANHFYSENKRVEKGLKYYEEGNIKEFGKLVTESGQSSIDNWETGSKELITLFNIIKNIDGVYGTRFAGSGFKGCCIALINPEQENSIIKQVKEKYIETYPKLKDKYSSHICKTADGIRL